MAFTPEPSRVPAAIGGIVITLKDTPAGGGEPASQSAHFQIEVLAADGARLASRRGNMVPHLTAGQLSNLQTFLANLRAKAEAEILPAP